MGPAERFAQARCCSKSEPVFQAKKEVVPTVVAVQTPYQRLQLQRHF
jgi:hypothetical protein